MTKKTINKFIIIAFLMVSSNLVQALELTEKLDLHAFVSQGYVFSPEVGYGGEESLTGTFKYREAALNLSWHENDNLHFSAQAMYRELDESVNEATIDFLLLDYLFYSGVEANYGIRLGRIKNQIGLYNSSRDIPGAKPSITVPHGYFDSVRDLEISTDGLEIYGMHNTELLTLELNLYLGQRDFDSENLEKYVLSQKVPAHYSASQNKGFSLKLHPNNLPNLMFGFSIINYVTELTDTPSFQQASTDFSTKDTEFHLTEQELDSYHAHLFAQFNYQKWLFTAEYIKVSTRVYNSAGFPINPFTGVPGPTLIEYSFDSEVKDYYLQAEYFTNNVSYMLRYESVNFDNDYGTDMDSKGLTLGIKWLINSNWILAGEYSMNEGTLWLPIYDGVSRARDKSWNVSLLKLTYQF